MAQVDLHLHSSRSDGKLSPAGLIHLCSASGLKIVALTDHDSTEGVEEAQEAATRIGDIEVISGVELSCDTTLGEVHILGLFVDVEAEDLQEFLECTRRGRRARGRQIVERLAASGVNLSFERVLEIADGGAVGRPHVARAMVEAGYVGDIKEAFDRFLGKGGAGYVARSRLTPVGAVEVLVRNRALPVLAHPLESAVKSGRREICRLEKVVSELASAGLAGLEVYYGDYTPVQVRRLELIAQRFGLIPCGGSDYHKTDTPGEPLPGSVGPPLETVETLRLIKRVRDHAEATV